MTPPPHTPPHDMTPAQKAAKKRRQTFQRRQLVDGYDGNATRAALHQRNGCALFIGEPVDLPRADTLQAVLRALWASYPEIHPSLRTICGRAGKCRNTVIKALDALRHDGVIDWTRRRDLESGRQNTSDYTIDFSRLKRRQGAWTNSKLAIFDDAQPSGSTDEAGCRSTEPECIFEGPECSSADSRVQFEGVRVPKGREKRPETALWAPSIRACASPKNTQEEYHAQESSSDDVGLAGVDLMPLRRAIVERALRTLFGLGPVDLRTLGRRDLAPTLAACARVLDKAMDLAGTQRVMEALDFVAREREKANRGEREPIASPAGLLLTCLERYATAQDVPRSTTAHARRVVDASTATDDEIRADPASAELARRIEHLRALIGETEHDSKTPSAPPPPASDPPTPNTQAALVRRAVG